MEVEHHTVRSFSKIGTLPEILKVFAGYAFAYMKQAYFGLDHGRGHDGKGAGSLSRLPSLSYVKIIYNDIILHLIQEHEYNLFMEQQYSILDNEKKWVSLDSIE